MARRAAVILLKHLKPTSKCSIMDPCAGQGALLNAVRTINPTVICHGVEIDKELCDSFGWKNADFLGKQAVFSHVNGIICNPPYARTRDGNSKITGRTLIHHFVRRSAELCDIMAFILLAPNSSPSGLRRLQKYLPEGWGVIQVDRVPDDLCYFDKPDGTSVFVSVSIFVFGPTNTIHKNVIIHDTDDFRVLKLDDLSAKLIVKRWGSQSRVCQHFIDNPLDIRAEVMKPRHQKGRGNSTNLHLFCKSPTKVKDILKSNVKFIRKYFAEISSQSSVAISPTDFCLLYIKLKTQ